MPKNNVSDPITDQEIEFARQILSGTMTDRQAAEAVGLNPDTAAYTKSKPRVRAYMLEHRAAVQQQLVEQDTEELRRFNLSRDRVLARLWEIADLAPEQTRNGMSAQVKALSMIIAMEGLIPDRRAVVRSEQTRPSARRPAILCLQMDAYQPGRRIRGPPAATGPGRSRPRATIRSRRDR